MDRAEDLHEETSTVLKVGVTGHRSLENEAALARDVRKVLGRIREITASRGGVPPTIELVSPIAEGTDRLVAREVLKDPTARLRVPLPFPKEDYMNDFESAGSKAEFEDLLERAYEVEVLPPTSTRDEGYEQVGAYMLDNCDVLIAIWDGRSPRGQGGTAEVVAEARKCGHPLFWIHADEPGVITEEHVSMLSTPLPQSRAGES